MENGSIRGFGLGPGVIVHFDLSSSFSVSHIGWNAPHTVKDSKILDDLRTCNAYGIESAIRIPRH